MNNKRLANQMDVYRNRYTVSRGFADYLVFLDRRLYFNHGETNEHEQSFFELLVQATVLAMNTKEKAAS